MSAKKRPMVPRGLVGLFWRVRQVGTGYKVDHIKRRMAEYAMAPDRKLYRITVWRKR